MFVQKRAIFLVTILFAYISLSCGLGISSAGTDSVGIIETKMAVPAEIPVDATSTPEPTATVAVLLGTTPQPTREAPLSPEPSPTPTEALNLADEQVLILPGVSPLALDPHLAGDAASMDYVVEIFSGLMVYDPELNLLPDIAESYEVSGDGLVYTFKLRPNVTFHDGKPIRAQDFKYSFERACDPVTGSNTAETYLGDIVGCREKLQGQVGDVVGVEVVDDLTLRLTIDEPKGFFLAKLTYPTAYVVDRENVERGGQMWSTQPNGSGPFKLAAYESGQAVISLQRNDHYYRDPQPILQEVRYIINSPLDPLAGYEQGFSTTGGVTYSVAKIGPDALSNIGDNLASQLVPVNLMSVYYIGFNVNQPPFDEVNVRRAFNLALDKRKIVKAYQVDSSVANGIVPLNMPGYQNPDLSDYEFDLEHARDLIAASSYGTASNLPPITLYVSDPDSIHNNIIASYKENLGLDITLQPVPWVDYLANLNQPDMPYQMFYLGWIADYPDPQNFLEILFHSESSQNYGGYHNSTVDELLNRARGTQDATQRLALYRDVEQMLLDDAAWIPLYFETEYWLVKPTVKNFIIPPMKVPKFQYAYIEAQ